MFQKNVKIMFQFWEDDSDEPRREQGLQDLPVRRRRPLRRRRESLPELPDDQK